MFLIMRTSRADAVLHPQRMAILRALATGPKTTKQLGEVLPDVPQATLYRHLPVLLDAGVLRIDAEQPVRGITERTYALADSAILSAEDLATASRDDHFRYFGTFVGGLLGEYARYLEQPTIDLVADGVGYREHVLNLTDAELRELLTDIRGAITARIDNQPTKHRTPRLIATASIPLHRTPGETE